jgi:heterodisulfide reductase subunit B
LPLEDWNCCGSSSAHSVDSKLGYLLPARNLALVPKGKPLFVACPSCYLRLKSAHKKLLADDFACREYELLYRIPVDYDLRIINFFELLSDMVDEGVLSKDKPLKGLLYVPYYGCMLARPPSWKKDRNFYGLMEKTLNYLGAESIIWPELSRCCGTYLSISKPDTASKNIGKIFDGAAIAGAECIVTACQMCHLNLELRATLPGKVPIFHIYELLALSIGIGRGMHWFKRHLIDPRPLLKSRKLID